MYKVTAKLSFTVFCAEKQFEFIKRDCQRYCLHTLIQCFPQKFRVGEIMEGNRDDARLLRRPNTLYLNENSCARIALRLASSCQDFTFLCYFFSSFFPHLSGL